MQKVFVASAVAGYTPRWLSICGGKDQIEWLKQPRGKKKKHVEEKGAWRERLGRLLLYYYCYNTREFHTKQIPKYLWPDFSDIANPAWKHSVIDSR